MAKNDLLTTAEAAERIGLATDTIRDYAASGRLRHARRVGRAYLFDRREVERFSRQPRPVGNPNFGSSHEQ